MKRNLRPGLAVLASAAVVGTALSFGAPATADQLDGSCSDGGYVRNGTINSPNHAPTAVDDTADAPDGGSVTIDVLANDTDPDEGDHKFVVSTSDPADGYTCIVDNKVVYYSYGDGVPTDSFFYSMTDGDYYRTAKVDVAITPIAKALPKVIRTKQVSHGKITRKAQVKVSNPDTNSSIIFYAGNFNNGEPDIHRTIAPGASTVVSTNRSHLDFETVSVTGNQDGGDFGGALLYFGGINTITGKVTADDVSGLKHASAAKKSAAKAWRVRH